MIVARIRLKLRSSARGTIGADVAPALAFLAFLIASKIAARAATVTVAPAYASLGMPVNVNVCGLLIVGIRAPIAETSEQSWNLMVTGEIVNLREAETSVPNLRITLRGEDRPELYL